MGSNIDISIIIPLYNSEKCVADTIKSIDCGLGTSIEILLIDDGSSDNTAKICESLVEHDARIRYYRQENKGVSAARNMGITLARGKWIMFCDHDDRYLPDLITQVMQAAVDGGVDFIKYGLRYTMNGEEIDSTHFPFTETQIIVPGSFLESYPILAEEKVYLYVWDGVYSSDFIKSNHIRFDETLRRGEEDRRFICDCISAFSTLLIIPQCLYEHVILPGQNTSSKYSEERNKAIEESMAYEYKALTSRFAMDEVDEFWPLRKLYYAQVYMHNVVFANESDLTLRDQRKAIKGFSKRHNLSHVPMKICKHSNKYKVFNALLRCHCYILLTIMLRFKVRYLTA